MPEPNVISFTAAAEEKDCARSTLYRAAERGQLETVEVGNVRMIVKDENWAAFTPEEKGARVQRRRQHESAGE